MKKNTSIKLLLSLSLLSPLTQAADLGALAGQTLKQVAPAAQSKDLLGNLMALGLNKNQAQGGMGALLQMAKGNLSGNEYTSLAKAIPGSDAMLGAVPKLDKSSGVSGLLSKAGGLGNSLQGSAMVYDSFAKLGISKDLAMPMVNVTKNYLQASGGDGTAGLLMKGLGGLM